MGNITKADLVKNVLSMVESGGLSPWSCGYDQSTIMPTNAETGKAYRGYNFLVGSFVGSRENSLLFATKAQWFKVAKRIGFFDKHSGGLFVRDDDGKIPAGEVFIFSKNIRKDVANPDPNDKNVRIDKDGQAYKGFFLYKTFMVWSAARLVPELRAMVEAAHVPNEHGTCDDFEQMVSTLGVEIGLGSPSYAPGSDKIEMPDKSAYELMEGYYGVMAHELIHWTAKRVGRDNMNFFGSQEYSFEELVAEWGSLLLRNKFGLVAPEVDNKAAAYIKGWSERLVNHPDAILDALRLAEKAVDYLIETGLPETKTETTEVSAVA